MTDRGAGRAGRRRTTGAGGPAIDPTPCCGSASLTVATSPGVAGPAPSTPSRSRVAPRRDRRAGRRIGRRQDRDRPCRARPAADLGHRPRFGQADRRPVERRRTSSRTCSAPTGSEALGRGARPPRRRWSSRSRRRRSTRSRPSAGRSRRRCAPIGGSSSPAAADARRAASSCCSWSGSPSPERRVDAYPHQLSGGQKQRVVIALALANEPVLLIADEPTTALDVTVQAEILRLLRDLRDRLGTAVLLITHNMGVVADLADRVVVLRHGRMVERGEVRVAVRQPVDRLHPRAARPLGPATAGPVRGRSGRRSARAGARPPRPAGTPVLAFRAVDVDYPGRLGRPSYRALHDVSRRAARPARCSAWSASRARASPPSGGSPSDLLRPQPGRIELAGVDLGAAGRAELRRLRRRIGVVLAGPGQHRSTRC